MNALKQKFKDVVFAVLPVTIILLILNYTIAPIGRELVWRFIVGAVFIILGLGIFLFGADPGHPAHRPAHGLVHYEKKEPAAAFNNRPCSGLFHKHSRA